MMNVFREMCRDEFESFNIYKYLSKAPFIPEKTREVLRRASRDEYSHYLFWRKISGECSSRFLSLKAFLYLVLLYLFGLTIVLKMLESKEKHASRSYGEIASTRLDITSEIQRIIDEENRHEEEFISSIREDRIKYIGSITLGISDALVELTGVYTGALGAFYSTISAGLMGLLTGIAASISMGIAAYNQARHEPGKSPVLSALYTMTAYIAVSILLAIPYFVIQSIYTAFITMIIVALLVIAYLNVYISILQGKPYAREFALSTILLLGVSLLLFYIGSLARGFLGL